MHRLVAASSVEDLLCARSQIDRGDVTLIVAVVTRVATVHHVEISRPVRGCDRQCRRTLFVEALECGGLWPESIDAFGAVTDLILVNVAVETVVVNILSIGIDGGRRSRIARASRQVDLTGPRSILLGPDLRSGLGIECDDAAIPGRDGKQVFGT